MKSKLLVMAVAVLFAALGACSSDLQDLPDAADGEDADGFAGDPGGDDGGIVADDDQPDGDPDIPQDGDGPDPDGQDGGEDGDGTIPADGDDPAADGDPGMADGDGGGADEDCSGSGPFDYTCEADQPETCPGGFCILGICIGPVLDPARWDDCGDEDCGHCETAELCPADCGEPPEMTGSKEYDNATTLTLWVHGFNNKTVEEMETMVYGEADGCGGILDEFDVYGTIRPCGETEPQAPNQIIEVEYYGGVPPAWMSQEDIDEIEQYPFDGVDALQRYALIVAKFLRHRIELSGATHVNLCCHSMGCLISRHMIENNLENLAAENRFVRWFSSAGVIGGAQLARLYDNPTIRDGAQLLGMELNDFVIMHPDFVQDTTCVWDHKLHEGNNPLFAGMIIHHACACDPQIEEALGIALLDIYNPEDHPNDGIMYTGDEYFHRQDPEASFVAPSGEVLAATHSLVHVDHMTLPNTDQAGLLATANLFHRRKVFITLDEIELLQDREHHEALDGEQGDPPAEIIAQVEVRYNPYVANTFGKDILVHDDMHEYRTPVMFIQNQGEVLQPGLTFFEGPVFDDMDQLQFDMQLLEVDWYPRMNVREYIFDDHEGLIDYHAQIPLNDHVIPVENEYVRIWIRVKVVTLY